MAEELHINLYDDIGPSVARDIAVTLLENPGADVVLRINSRGGNVTDGYAIASALRSHTGRKVAVVEGLCASAATFPACACDEIHMHSESIFMIHAPWGDASGRRADLEKQGALLDKMADQCMRMYQRKSGASEEQVRAWLSTDTNMGPEEAVAAGFCDKILTDAITPVARAYAQRCMAMLRKPQAKAKSPMNLPETLLAKLREYGLGDDMSADEIMKAYRMYMEKTTDGPDDRQEMSRAVMAMSDGDDDMSASAKAKPEDDKEDDEDDKPGKASAKSAQLDPAVSKLVDSLKNEHASMAKRVEAMEAKERAAEESSLYAFAKTRHGVSDADVKEYLELSGKCVARARALIAKHPEKTTMTKMTQDGRPRGAGSVSASEAEVAPMSGRHQLHGFALAKQARAGLPKDRAPTFEEVKAAQVAVVKARPDLWG